MPCSGRQDCDSASRWWRQPALLGDWLLRQDQDQHALQAWLAGFAAAAVLVRPDRYVFGTGEAGVVNARWQAALGLDPPA